MTWRTVVISSNCKLDLRLNYLVIRTDEIRKVHLSEIAVLMVESTAVSMTAMLLCELTKRKIKVIFCDEKHNPYGELIPYHGCHDSPDKLRIQISWSEDVKGSIWREIIREKIRKQAMVLDSYDPERASMLWGYVDEVQHYDVTNREGHAAKVYFNTLFGTAFSRKDECVTNACLDYGYAILLSAVNREICALGYSTELGIFHDNCQNHFNFGSDIMEPLRPLVDTLVLNMNPSKFDADSKRVLANLLNTLVTINDKEMHLVNALPTYVKSVTDSLIEGNVDGVRFCEYEGPSHEIDSIL